MHRPSPASFIHLSNLLTYVSLLFGVAAIAAAMSGSAAAAGALIAAAAIADTFDGRFARTFTRSRELASMGAQLDSLADAVTFGIAPVVIAGLLFRPSGGPAVWIWWSAAFVYAACALTRLGFYNVWDGDSSGFVGLPVPVAALCWSTLLLLDAGTVALTIVALSTSLAMI
jgi:CDP-diacylglycerol--serine O-phosphatidyltransferase